MEKKVVNQKEYLKKYLSSGTGDDKKKKKKKKLKIGSETVKIIDDDIDLKNMRPIEDNEFDIFIDAEDAPQIAGVVDERGPVDFSDKRRWKIMANDEGGDLTITSHEKGTKKSRKVQNDFDDDLSPPRTSKAMKIQRSNMNTKEDEDEDSDLSPPRRKSKKHIHSKHKTSKNGNSDNNLETDIPVHKIKKKTKRKNNVSDSDLSPPRQGTNYDSDLSPPRRSKKHKSEKSIRDTDKRYSDLSPPRQSKKYDSDLSPPRRSKKHRLEKSIKDADKRDSDLSPPRKNRKDCDSDLSPPRKNRKGYDSDLSPPRKNKKGYDSDLSPPRKNKNEYDSDLSPPRKNRKGSDSDLSPPRMSRKDEFEKSKKNKNYADLSKRRNHKNSSDSDLSPPRRHEKYTEPRFVPKQKDKNDNAEFSPSEQSKRYKSSYFDSKRSRHNGSDLSAQREHKNTNSHVNLHNETRGHKYSDKNSRSDRRHNSDLSLPLKKNRTRDTSPSRFREDDRDSYKTKRSKWSSKYEQDVKQHSQRESSYNNEKSERHTNNNKRFDSRHRNIREEDDEKRMKKTLDGKTAGLQDARALREETEAHRKREAEHFSKLSKEVTGVGQAVVMRDSRTGKKRNLEAEAAEDREKQKRQSELNEKYAKWGKGLKQVEDREEKLKDDLYEMSKPLARYADDADLDRRLREQDREGDPMLEYIKQKQIKEGKRKPDRPSYEGGYMLNRFGIKPGHRWDGVDRSNGYEKRWFEAQNAKKAVQEEAYKWSTSDM